MANAKLRSFQRFVTPLLTPTVVNVAISATHSFSKQSAAQILLLAGLGVQGDAHCGVTVKHRSRVARDPTQPNLRQVHLLQSELLEQLQQRGFAVAASQVGENILTQNLALLDLPTDTELQLGETAIVKITGLRNPCAQLDAFSSGLMAAVLDRDDQGSLVRKCGVMAVVLQGGVVRPSDPIRMVLPSLPYRKLEPV